MAVWQCRLLLGIVVLHIALSSPLVRRDVLSLGHEPPHNPLAEMPAETLGEDAFGPTLDNRGGREKRLLKTLGLGALGVKAAKAVGTKVVTTGAKAIGATALKAGAAVKAVATGAIGLKAKAFGLKAVTAVAALGIKALIVKLLFGLSKSSLQPRKMPTTTSAPITGGDDQIPEFDPNKISLQVPDALFAPAFNSVNSISTVIGDLIQGTAERVARLVERLKPLLQSSLGFRSRKRQTEKEEEPIDNGTTFFSESDVSASNDEESASSDSDTLSSNSAEESSPIKNSFAALSDNSWPQKEISNAHYKWKYVYGASS